MELLFNDTTNLGFEMAFKNFQKLLQSLPFIGNKPSCPVRSIGSLSIFFLFCFFHVSLCSAESIDASGLPSLFSAVRIDSQLTFCGEKVELDKNDTRERMEKEMLLTLWDRPQVVLWIKRSNRYFPVIEQKLREHGMPEDLKYIALVESALRPHIGSPRGAVGFWQFTRSTGRKYGLKIDSEKDERRNIFKSTDAAIEYLKELYATFGSWTLAAAAYNMGEHGLEAEVMVQEKRNFYDLYLPLETQQYVFRIVSAKRIITHPKQYGFNFSQKDLYPPLEYDQINIECFEETPVAVIARAANTSFKVIKDMNPELRGYYLGPGKHILNIPKGCGKAFHARFKTLIKKWEQEQKGRVYVVKKGDNLSSIAERFNIPLPILIIWNNLDYEENIHPGDRLVIRPSPEFKHDTE